MKKSRIIKCRQCKETFTTTNKLQVFCKDSCRVKSHRQKAKNRRLKCENPKCDMRTSKQFCKDCVVIISELINEGKQQ